MVDKDKLVRSCTLDTIETWRINVGAESIINLTGKLITPDNPEIWTALLKFLIDNKDSIRSSEGDQLVKPLIECLCDKTPEIRKLAEDVVYETMRSTSYE